MFKQFYKDIDTLHELVKPFAFQASINSLYDSLDIFRANLGSILSEAIKINDADNRNYRKQP